MTCNSNDMNLRAILEIIARAMLFEGCVFA